MKLRPYQERCISRIIEELRDRKSTLAVLPTGTGKTVIFSDLARRWPDAGRGKVLVVAHREELIFQAKAKIEAATGEPVDVEMGDLTAAPCMYGAARVVVTSVQTMSRPGRLKRYDPRQFGLVVIDEAHHAVAASYRKVIDHYMHRDCRLVGVTATPDRADEEALGKVFESVAMEYRISDAINDGWLVPIDQQFVQVTGLDFSDVRTTAGDLNGGDLEAVMTHEERLHGVAYPTIDMAGDRPTIVFAASVAHAERLAEIFNRHRAKSAHCLHGETPPERRRDLLRAYKAGDFQFLCNCGLFLEGFDEPSIAVVANARPTKSRSLYAQCVGRGTRPLPGVVDNPPIADQWEPDDRKEAIACSSKPAVLVLDFVGNSGRHKLVSCADILGEACTDEVVERARASAVAKSRAGKPTDMQLELIAAQKAADDEAAARRRAHIKARARYATNKVDPFDVFDVSERREPGWHKGRMPTERQLEVLQKAGIDTDGMTFHKASQLIDQIIRRRDQGLCTFKQAKLLAKYGYDPAGMTFEQAAAAINELAANRWQKPPTVMPPGRAS